MFSFNWYDQITSHSIRVCVCSNTLHSNAKHHINISTQPLFFPRFLSIPFSWEVKKTIIDKSSTQRKSKIYTLSFIQLPLWCRFQLQLEISNYPIFSVHYSWMWRSKRHYVSSSSLNTIYLSSSFSSSFLKSICVHVNCLLCIYGIPMMKSNDNWYIRYLIFDSRG